MNDLTDEQSNEESYPISDYKITTTPNDFNVMTIVSFIESGMFKIPNFQRNYVWDINRASKLIESLLIGLPIPQIFLYEITKNEFLVIDGQQRLMTIYYFMKGKFPKKSKRTELRHIFDEKGIMPDNIINNNEYFLDFKLKLSKSVKGKENQFNNLTIHTLDDPMSLKLATIRNMIIKPITSDNENNSMFEIFNRLNSGGMNLTPQEIRMSLYNSVFMQELTKMNTNKEWRVALGKEEAEIRLNDVELILRVFAVLCHLDEYKYAFTGFLNSFCGANKELSKDNVDFLSFIWSSFWSKNNKLSDELFKSSTNKFSIVHFESAFYASCHEAYVNKDVTMIKAIDENYINRLKNDEKFKNYCIAQRSSKDSLLGRIERAKIML